VLRLPIPLLTPHRFSHSTQHLTGGLHLRILRDGRHLYEGHSPLASLETGGAHYASVAASAIKRG
jgi:tocopherol cyclase